MVVETEGQERTDRIFHALSDVTRRDILGRAMEGGQSVSALAGHYPMSFAAVQKHVAVLERAGLVSKHRQGREQRVQSNIDTIREAFRLLDQLEAIWRSRIDRFGDVLAEQPEGDTK